MNKTLSWIAYDLGRAQMEMSTMTTQERGIWISLLTRCAVVGYIEPDWNKLRVTCGVTAKHIPTIQKVLSEYFEMIDGVWIHSMIQLSHNFVKQKSALPKKPLKTKAQTTHTDIHTDIQYIQTNKQKDNTDIQTYIQTEEQEEQQLLTSDSLRARGFNL